MATYRVAYSNAYLMKEPSMKSTKIQKLYNNGKFEAKNTISNSEGTWAEHVNGNWACIEDSTRKYMLPYQQGQKKQVVYKIIKDGVYLREGPSIDFEKIKPLSKNGKFTADEILGNWAHHVNNGWADISGMEIYKDPTTPSTSSSGQFVYKVIVEGNQLREQPNDSAKIKQTLFNGGKFTAVEVRGDWARHVSGGWARIVGPDGKIRMVLMTGDKSTTPTQAVDTGGTVSAPEMGLSKEEINDFVTKSLHSKGIFTGKELYVNRFAKFSRIKLLDTYSLGPTTEYVFFTKPDLHIFNGDDSVLNPELIGNPVFSNAVKTHRSVLRSLQYSIDKVPFVPLLTNQIKSSVDVPTLSADDSETAENLYGVKMSYRRASLKSDQDFEINIEFNDDMYLDVYMWFKLFDEYERLKYLGSVTPPSDFYRLNKILHDQFSIYKFIVAEDMETLIYWAKLYGVYPKGAPRDAFSDMSSNTGLSFSVPFKCQWVDDMDPLILADFNYTVNNWKNATNYATMKWFDEEMQGFNGEWADTPFITYDVSDNDATQMAFKFKWRGGLTQGPKQTTFPTNLTSLFKNILNRK